MATMKPKMGVEMESEIPMGSLDSITNPGSGPMRMYAEGHCDMTPMKTYDGSSIIPIGSQE